jgi:hypothetical protein
MAELAPEENEYLAYEWGDPKNPDYIEWLINIVDSDD